MLVAGSGFAQPSAPAPAMWKLVTDLQGKNTDDPAVARTRDGALHVVWLRHRSGLADLMHTAVTRGGSDPIITGRRKVSNADLVVTANGGLQTFFITETTVDRLQQYVSAATAAADGRSWKVQQGITKSASLGSEGGVGATTSQDGTPVQIFSTTRGVHVHAGTDPASPEQEITSQFPTYVPDLARDAGGDVFGAWFSLDNKAKGQFVRRVLPSGGPMDFVPGTVLAGNPVSVDQRMPITGRIGAPGVYMAYGQGNPNLGRVLLWRVGAGKPLQVSGAFRQHYDVNIAAAPEGRLWVMWHTRGTFTSRGAVYAVRTNRTATRLGAVVAVAAPTKGIIWTLRGEGSLGPLDVLATAETTSPNGKTGTWHARLFPGLSLSTKQIGAKVVFTVTDAGDAVPAATVKAGGLTATTNARGQAIMAVAAGRATATKKGYTAAAARFR